MPVLESRLLLFLIFIVPYVSALELKVLTNSDIESYMATGFNKSKMAFKTVILGVHNGFHVIAEHPCADVCPNHTVRVVRYDVPLSNCSNAKGIIVKHTIPYGIGTKQVDYCVPNVNLGNVLNKRYGTNKNT